MTAFPAVSPGVSLPLSMVAARGAKHGRGLTSLLLALLAFLVFVLLELTHLHQPIHDTLPAEIPKHRLLPADASSPWAGAAHLVIVAGHAVFHGLSYTEQNLLDESLWTLESFQHNQLRDFIAHIRLGVETVARRPPNSSLLIFSGGETRQGAGPRSEAQVYWQVAEAFDWWGHRDTVRHNALTEEFARDSFENLLFALCRFEEVADRPAPASITVVSFSFKERRFRDLHRFAIRYPLARFHFLAPQEPPTRHSSGRIPSAGEAANALGPFQADLFGCRNQLLTQKRDERNPFRRSHPYPRGCPALGPLFSYCANEPYPGALPWSNSPSA